MQEVSGTRQRTTEENQEHAAEIFEWRARRHSAVTQDRAESPGADSKSGTTASVLKAMHWIDPVAAGRMLAESELADTAICGSVENHILQQTTTNTDAFQRKTQVHFLHSRV